MFWEADLSAHLARQSSNQLSRWDTASKWCALTSPVRTELFVPGRSGSGVQRFTRVVGDWVPKAWRNKESTITIRVKPVIINRIAGKKDSAVKKSRVWMGTEKLILEPPVPTNKGSCPEFCAETVVCSATADIHKRTLPKKARRFKNTSKN